MAMDIYILMKPGTEPDKDYLNRQSGVLELGLTFESDQPITETQGTFSVLFNGEKSGFDIRAVDPQELMATLPAHASQMSEPLVAYHIKFGYAHFSPVAAYHTAAIFSTIEGTVVFETQNNGYKDTTALIMIGKQMYDSLYRHN